MIRLHLIIILCIYLCYNFARVDQSKTLSDASKKKLAKTFPPRKSLSSFVNDPNAVVWVKNKVFWGVKENV